MTAPVGRVKQGPEPRLRVSIDACTQVYVTEGSYCDNAGPTEAEVVESLVQVCLGYWSTRNPGPDGPMTCPLLAELPGELRPEFIRLCEEMRDETICPEPDGY
jgi:hypothetical protein